MSLVSRGRDDGKLGYCYHAILRHVELGQSRQRLPRMAWKKEMGMRDDRGQNAQMRRNTHQNPVDT